MPTIAERIARALGDDGQRFETTETTINELIDQYPHTQQHDEDRRLTRYVFEDGSTLVVGENCWDIEGLTPFSWRGVEKR